MLRLGMPRSARLTSPGLPYQSLEQFLMLSNE
jgi:hypothetical protein